MFVAFYTNDQVVIDDVSVERSTTLSAPTTYKATDYTPDGFTAHWSAAKGATHYLFSLFHNEATPVTEDHAYTENFASLASASCPRDGPTSRRREQPRRSIRTARAAWLRP